MRQLRDLPDGITRPSTFDTCVHGDDLCAVVMSASTLSEVHTAVRLALHEFQLRAGLAADHLPGQQIAVVLHNGHQHLIARLDMVRP